MPKSPFTDAYTAFVQALIAARKDAGLTQAEVARRVGREQPFVSLVERGVRRLDVIEFYAFARALGADPGALYSAITATLPETTTI